MSLSCRTAHRGRAVGTWSLPSCPGLGRCRARACARSADILSRDRPDTVSVLSATAPKHDHPPSYHYVIVISFAYAILSSWISTDPFIGKRQSMKSKYWVFGTLLGCVLLLAIWPTREVQAHFCNDNFSEQQIRENCWWRYWNGLTTDTDRQAPAVASSTTSSAASAVDGTFCDRFFTNQKDRENCWWRYWNGLPLIPASAATSPSTPKVTRGNPSGTNFAAIAPSSDPEDPQVIIAPPRVTLNVPGHDPVNVELDPDGSTDLSELSELDPDCDEATLNIHVDENGNVTVEVVECRSKS